MIFGIGVDIVEVARVKKLIADRGDPFLARVFSDEEITYCRGRKDEAVHYAGRFAAKEAFLKAIGTGLPGGISLFNITVVNDCRGKPQLRLTGNALFVLASICSGIVHVSISHTRKYAVACVTIENPLSTG